jgi:hypothetical protein
MLTMQDIRLSENIPQPYHSTVEDLINKYISSGTVVRV